MVRVWIAVAAIATLALGRAEPTLAVTADSLGLLPARQEDPARPWLNVSLSPGEARAESIRLVNQGSAPQNIHLSAVDAVPLEQGLGMSPDGQEPSEAGSWIQLSESRVTLLPGETKEIGISIQAPQNVAVGNHYAGIIAENEASVPAAGVHVIHRLGLRVYFMIRGDPHDSLKIKGVECRPEPTRAVCRISIANAGNTLLVPFGSITIHEGSLGSSVPITEKPLQPGQSDQLTVSIGLRPHTAPSKYRADVALGSRTSKTVHAAASTRFWRKGSVWFYLTFVVLLVVFTLILQRVLLNNSWSG